MPSTIWPGCAAGFAAAKRRGLGIATSEESDATLTLAALSSEIAVVAALTGVHSRTWLEQMIARATCIDPRADP